MAHHFNGGMGSAGMNQAGMNQAKTGTEREPVFQRSPRPCRMFPTSIRFTFCLSSQNPYQGAKTCEFLICLS